MVTAVAERMGLQVPRVRSVPAYVSSRGREAVEVAASFGLILDPWQELEIIDACGCKEDGKWAAIEVATDVPRQNGKGGTIEARELAGIFAWGERMILHSSHEFATSMEAMLRMEDLLAGTPEYASQVKSVSRSHGAEGFIFKTGQRLRYRTRTKGGGRGFTIDDTLILDEAMILQEAFIGALLPTLSARSMYGNPQVWYAGSAVDQLVHEHGIVFARLRERGMRGGDPSLAWFEHSAEFFDGSGRLLQLSDLTEEMLADPEGWAQANPGLGIRISEDHVEKELRSMDARTFAVERLGVGDWPATDGSGGAAIDVKLWDALVDVASKIDGAPCFAFDVSPDRASASIAAAGGRLDGLGHVEVVDHRRGTGWLVDRLVELDQRHSPTGVMCDQAGPAASLVHELEERGVKVTMTDSTEHAHACGLLFDGVTQKTLRHLGTSELRAAVRGAAKRPLGDAWAWSRKTSVVDISPLVACTLAFWGRAQVAAEIQPFVL